LWFLSVWLSRQIQHWLSAAAAVTAVVAAVTEAAVAVAVTMAAEETSVVAADLMAAENIVVAAPRAARGLMAEEVTTKVAGMGLAAIMVRLKIGRRQAFLAQSTMASGIRSATPVVRLVPRVWVKDAIPEARRTRASRLVTPEVSRAVGTLLALQAGLRREARLVLPAEPPDLRRALLGVAIGAVTVGAVTTVGAVAVAMVGVGGGGGWGGWGWGFGFGWPYWGFGWGLGWAPWWYNPYWYAPWPAYGYPYYSDYWYDSYNNPPYRLDSPSDYDSQGSSLIAPSLNSDDGNLNLNRSTVQNGPAAQPEAAPNSPAPAIQPEPSLSSESQT